MNSTTITNARRMTVTAILSACAAVLMFVSFKIPIMPNFISMDFSELPALLASFTLGPLSGATVCLIKNVINLFMSQTGGVGELSNFILGLAFVVPAGLLYRRNKTRKTAVIGSLVGAFLMAALSVFSNFFLVYPIYFNFMPLETILQAYHTINPVVGIEPTSENLLKALLMFNMPFTFVKGLVSVIVTVLIYKPLSPIINGKSAK